MLEWTVQKMRKQCSCLFMRRWHLQCSKELFPRSSSAFRHLTLLSWSSEGRRVLARAQFSRVLYVALQVESERHSCSAMTQSLLGRAVRSPEQVEKRLLGPQSRSMPHKHRVIVLQGSSLQQGFLARNKSCWDLSCGVVKGQELSPFRKKKGWVQMKETTKG